MTQIRLNLMEGHYAILQDKLKDMATEDAIMEDADANGDMDTYEVAFDRWERAAHRVAEIVYGSVTGEMRKALVRHEKRIEGQREP